MTNVQLVLSLAYSMHCANNLQSACIIWMIVFERRASALIRTCLSTISQVASSATTCHGDKSSSRVARVVQQHMTGTTRLGV